MTSSSRRSIYMPDEDWAILAELAQAEDRSTNSLIRIIIRRHLDRQVTAKVPVSGQQELPPAPTLTERIRDTFGVSKPAPKPKTKR